MRPSGLPMRPGHHLATHEGDMFSLTMLVEAADLDTYICAASNVYGSDESTIVLSGPWALAVGHSNTEVLILGAAHGCCHYLVHLMPSGTILIKIDQYLDLPHRL